MTRGVATKFRLGRRITTGGTYSGELSHLPPNSDFTSDFDLILGMLANLKILANIQKIVLKNCNFLVTSHSEFRTGGTRPPTGSDAHAHEFFSEIAAEPLGGLR